MSTPTAAAATAAANQCNNPLKVPESAELYFLSKSGLFRENPGRDATKLFFHKGVKDFLTIDASGA